MSSSEYKAKYDHIFKKDFSFSKEYSKDANKHLLSELATIIDYETTINGTPHPLDLQGYDRRLTISFSFGVRIRDVAKSGFAEFTIDNKELSHQIDDPHYYYFFAYASPNEHKIDFCMIFDYKKLKQLFKEGVIKPSQGQNKQHSAVSFLGFKISELFKHHLIIAYQGEPKLVSQLGLPPEEHFRLDRIEVAKP